MVPWVVNGGLKIGLLGLYWCKLGIIWGLGWVREGDDEGEDEGGVGARGRGVSLIIGEQLLWEDLVSVACMGVMKFDWLCGIEGVLACDSRVEGEEVVGGGVCWGLLGFIWEGWAFIRGCWETTVPPPVVDLLAKFFVSPTEGRVWTNFTPIVPNDLCCGGKRGEAVGGGRGFADCAVFIPEMPALWAGPEGLCTGPQSFSIPKFSPRMEEEGDEVCGEVVRVLIFAFEIPEDSILAGRVECDRGEE